jgi:hypothetical protein
MDTRTDGPDYRLQDCGLTVLEGLAEYRTLMPDLIDETRLQGPSRQMFHNHDLCHVVFGCDISLRHEGMVDTWTMIGSDVGVRAYVRYLQLPEVKGLFAQIGFVRGLVVSIQSVPSLLRVIRNARRMKAKWPWSDHERYLDRPLRDVRAELGIVVVP